MFSRRSVVKVGASGVAVSLVGLRPAPESLAARENASKWKQQWSFQFDGPLGDNPKFINYGRYLLQSPRRLLCFKESDLRPDWEVEVSNPIESVDTIPSTGSEKFPMLHVKTGSTSHFVDIGSGKMVSIEGLSFKAELKTYNEYLISTVYGRSGATGTVYDRSTGKESFKAVGYHYVFDDKIVVWDNFTNEISMHHIESGDVVWVTSHSSAYRMSHFENTIIVTGGDSVSGLDIGGGDEVWKASVPSGSFMIVSSNGYVVMDHESKVFCLDARDGSMVWEVIPSSYEERATSRRDSGPVIWIAMPDGNDLLFSRLTGEVLVHGDLDFPGGVSDFDTYIIGDSVVAIDRETATVIARWEIPPDTMGTLTSGTQVVFLGLPVTHVMDSATGERRTISVNKGFQSARLYRGVLFIGYSDNRIDVYNAETLEKIAEGNISMIFEVIEQDDLVIINDSERILVFDTRSQKILFERERPARYVGGFESDIMFWGEVGSYDELVMILALDRAGQEMWRIYPEDPIGLFQIGGDTSMLADSKYLYAMDTKSGEYTIKVEGMDSIWLKGSVIKNFGAVMINTNEAVMYGE